MDKFPCAIDEEAESFCDGIAENMANIFDIENEEAVGRINEHWKDVKIGGPNEIAYHEDAEFWAKQIYYENGTYWWQAEWMKEHNPRAKPYSKTE